MNQVGAIRIGLMVCISLLPIGCAAVQGDDQQEPWPISQLTPAEERLARQLAEQELFGSEHGIQPGERIYFTRVQLLPGSHALAPQREVIVTHYRYRGNQAILTTVDLHQQMVVNVEKVTNLPTPLAAEEFELALELARNDARIANLWTEYGSQLHVEGKLGWPAEIADPTQPHRNVYLLFRVGRNYLNSPRVMVDLVNQQVAVEEVAAE